MFNHKDFTKVCQQERHETGEKPLASHSLSVVFLAG
jgi:hypothetical protein